MLPPILESDQVLTIDDFPHCAMMRIPKCIRLSVGSWSVDKEANANDKSIFSSCRIFIPLNLRFSLDPEHPA